LLLIDIQTSLPEIDLLNKVVFEKEVFKSNLLDFLIPLESLKSEVEHKLLITKFMAFIEKINHLNDLLGISTEYKLNIPQAQVDDIFSLLRTKA